jgi:hypothetical protein
MDENKIDHLAGLLNAQNEDDFKVFLNAAELVEILEYIALNIFQLRKVVNESVPMLEGLAKNPMLKALFPKVR